MGGSVPAPEIIVSTFTASAPVLRPHPNINERLRLPHYYSDPLPARRKKPSESKLSLHLPQALVISGLEYATDLTQRTFAKVLAERQVILESGQNRLDGETDNRKTGEDDNDEAWNLPDGFITVYVCPLDARKRPPIHKTLVCTPRNLSHLDF